MIAPPVALTEAAHGLEHPRGLVVEALGEDEPGDDRDRRILVEGGRETPEPRGRGSGVVIRERDQLPL